MTSEPKRYGLLLREQERRLIYPVEWFVGLATAWVMVVPRSMPFVFSVTALAMAGVVVRRTGFPTFQIRDVPGWIIASAVLGAWVVLGSLWSIAPLVSLTLITQSALIVAGTALGLWAATRLEAHEAWLLCRAVFYGLIFGMVYLGIELATKQVLLREFFAYNRWVDPPPETSVLKSDKSNYYFGPVALNRNVTVLVMLTWPTLWWLCKRSAPMTAAAWTRAILFGAAALAVTLMSTHSSSKVALLCSACVFGFALLKPRLALAFVTSAWIVLSLFMLPLASVVEKAGLKNAEWVKVSGRQRIAIWGATAEATHQKFLRGIGAGATPYHPLSHAAQSRINSHAHNIYLQVWFELGAIGAILLSATGLFILRAMSRLSDDALPLALTQVSAFIAMSTFAYGFWQTWLNATYALGAICVAIALRAGALSAAEPRTAGVAAQ